jgi:hypothetical protein
LWKKSKQFFQFFFFFSDLLRLLNYQLGTTVNYLHTNFEYCQKAIDEVKDLPKSTWWQRVVMQFRLWIFDIIFYWKQPAPQLKI